jgi:hypothetical protein
MHRQPRRLIEYDEPLVAEQDGQIHCGRW